MKIIPDIRLTFGDTYFLGFKEKWKYDPISKNRTDEVEGFICKLASSAMAGQVEVTIPPAVNLSTLGFNQKVTLKGVEIDPYAKGSEKSSYAQVVLRCTAESILEDGQGKTVPDRNPNVK